VTGGLLQYRMNFNPVATLSTCGAIPLLPHVMLAVPVQCYQPTHAIRLTTHRLHATVLFAKPTGRFVWTTCVPCANIWRTLAASALRCNFDLLIYLCLAKGQFVKFTFCSTFRTSLRLQGCSVVQLLQDVTSLRQPYLRTCRRGAIPLAFHTKPLRVGTHL
jgi:hypothetical protein